MRYERYGLVLRSMAATDLEMVRNWRNAPHVQENMEFREEISPEMQQRWFAGLDPDSNLYLIALSSDRPFAVLHVKDIDWESKRGEAGVFVGEPEFLGSFLPVTAVLALMELAFWGLGLEILTAKVRSDRPNILDFNRRLGYSAVTPSTPTGFQRLECSPSSFQATALPIRQKAETFQRQPIRLEFGDTLPGRWMGSAEELVGMNGGKNI